MQLVLSAIFMEGDDGFGFDTREDAFPWVPYRWIDPKELDSLGNGGKSNPPKGSEIDDAYPCASKY